MISLGESIEATTTTTVEKKNTDRSLSQDRRAIADLRRVNLMFDTKQYYPIAVPSIYDIARRIMGLINMYPGLTLKVTNRDDSSAFRLLRLRPALCLVMVAEFPEAHVHIAAYLVCFYLAVPFGWNGAPAQFAFFGDSITIAHIQFGLSKASSTLMRHSYRPSLYVDDGIFADVDVPERLFPTAQ